MSWVSGASQKGRDIGAAEAAGAPETGGKEDAVERKRLFHRGTVHPGAGAKPGLNQRRLTGRRKQVSASHSAISASPAGWPAPIEASNSRIAAASAMGRQLRISASRRQYRAMLRA